MQLAIPGLTQNKPYTLSGGGGGGGVVLPPGARTQALAVCIPGVVEGEGVWWGW